MAQNSLGLLLGGLGVDIRQVQTSYDHKNYMAASMNWESFLWVSLQDPQYFGVYVMAPDFWKLPFACCSTLCILGYTTISRVRVYRAHNIVPIQNPMSSLNMALPPTILVEAHVRSY